jgi:AraC family transcriptional regulator
MGSPRFRSFETEHLRVTEAWFPPRSVLEPHTHDRAILAVMCRGGFRTKIANRTLDCAAGFAWTEPLGERHANFVGAEGAHVVVLQPSRESGELFRKFSLLLESVQLMRHPGVAREVPRMLSELRNPEALTALSVDALAMMLLVAAARANASDRNHRAPKWLMLARDLLHEEWRKTSLSRIAAAVDIHPCHLAHAFRDHFGESIGSYARELRLNWAVGQLADASQSIAHVAAAAGFCDQSHFTRDCRRRLGMTPAEYRASMD